MNIAIDTSPLASGHQERGIGMYTKELIAALSMYASNHTYVYIEKKGAIPKNIDVVHYPFFDPFFLTLPMSVRKPTVVTVHDLIPLVFPSQFRPQLYPTAALPPQYPPTATRRINRFSLSGESLVMFEEYQH